MPWMLNYQSNNLKWKTLHNVFSDDELNRIIKECNQDKFEARIADGYRQSFVAKVEAEEYSNTWMFSKIEQALSKVNQEHFKFDLTYIETMQFTEYSADAGGQYLAHTDNVSLSSSPRKLSFSVQLTDPGLYEGGDLQFLHLSLDPEKAPRTRGSVTFFPGFLVHEVTQVTKGTRHSLVGWVAGPPFK